MKNHKLLLDGSKMPEKRFYKRFKEIVGTTVGRWENRKSVKQDNGAEFYSSEDAEFWYCGSAYDPPKLYRKIKGVEKGGK